MITIFIIQSIFTNIRSSNKILTRRLSISTFTITLTIVMNRSILKNTTLYKIIITIHTIIIKPISKLLFKSLIRRRTIKTNSIPMCIYTRSIRSNTFEGIICYCFRKRINKQLSMTTVKINLIIESTSIKLIRKYQINIILISLFISR